MQQKFQLLFKYVPDKFRAQQNTDKKTLNKY